MFTWTDNIYDSIWDHLRLFTSPENVKRLLEGQIESNREISFSKDIDVIRKSRQISYSISHAFEYFQAAGTISINTSPLLYFYGMLSLTKALLVANCPYILLEDINYHGLHTRPITDDLRQYSKNQSHWALDREYVVTNEGVFKQLTNLIHGFQFPNSSIIHWKNLLSLDPEISDIFRKYYKEKPKVRYLRHHKTVDEPSKDFFRIELSIEDSEDSEFNQNFPEFHDYFQRDDIYSGKRWVGYKNKDHIKSFPECYGVYSPATGGTYLIGSLEYKHSGLHGKRHIDVVIGDYVKMFILSNCVRYKQEFWTQIVQGEREGSVGLVNLFISIAKRRFPHFILNNLFNETFEYGSPGWLT